MYSVAYHYAKDLDSDVVVTSRRPTLFAYYSELFELSFGKLSFCFRTTRCCRHPPLEERHPGTPAQGVEPTKARHLLR